MFRAGEDYLLGRFPAGSILEIGLEDEESVFLAANGAFVPESVLEAIEVLKAAIIAGDLVVRTEYTGPEHPVAPWC